MLVFEQLVCDAISRPRDRCRFPKAWVTLLLHPTKDKQLALLGHRDSRASYVAYKAISWIALCRIHGARIFCLLALETFCKLSFVLCMLISMTPTCCFTTKHIAADTVFELSIVSSSLKSKVRVDVAWQQIASTPDLPRITGGFGLKLQWTRKIVGNLRKISSHNLSQSSSTKGLLSLFMLKLIEWALVAS